MTDQERQTRVEQAVRARNGRLDRSEVRFTCPEGHRHHNGDANPSARWNPAKQVWRCDVCEAGGGWIDLEKRLGLGEDLSVRPSNRTEVDATYDYRDAGGALVYQAVRLRPKSFRLRCPDRFGGWTWKLGDVPRVLYRLPEILAGPREVPVYLVEGEKDADALVALGLSATTNVGGAGKWLDTYSESLRGRDVVILPDNDSAGWEHATKAARSLSGVAASIRLVSLPNLPEKGDVSDFLRNGGSRAQLEALVAATDSIPALQSPSLPESNPEPDDPRWRPVLIDDLTAADTAVSWVLHGYLSPGAITLLVGLWKAGKTTLLVHLLRALAVGESSFAGLSLTATRVLVVSEEPPMIWRLRRERFDLSGISIVSRPFVRRPDLRAWERFIEYLSHEIRRHNIGLVVFDTLGSFWPVSDENDASQVTAALMPLRSLQHAAVMLVHHPRKGDAAEGQAARGSGALPGFVELIVELRRFDPARRDDTRRVLTSYSRFDETPPELVLQYDPEAGYEAIGTKRDTGRADRLAVVRTMVATAPLTADMIRETWAVSDLPKPGLRTLRADLEAAFKNLELERLGAGTRGDPYRYGPRDSSDARAVSIPASTDSEMPESLPVGSLGDTEATWTG